MAVKLHSQHLIIVEVHWRLGLMIIDTCWWSFQVRLCDQLLKQYGEALSWIKKSWIFSRPPPPPAFLCQAQGVLSGSWLNYLGAAVLENPRLREHGNSRIFLSPKIGWALYGRVRKCWIELIWRPMSLFSLGGGLLMQGRTAQVCMNMERDHFSQTRIMPELQIWAITTLPFRKGFVAHKVLWPVWKIYLVHFPFLKKWP